MKVLCLDLGGKTGWAIRSHSELFSGATKLVHNRRQRDGHRFRLLYDHIGALYSSFRFGKVCYEEVVRHSKQDGTKAAHAYGGYVAIISMWCYDNQVKLDCINVKTVKRLVTGNGNASKKDVSDYVFLSQKHRAPTYDESDAIAVLIAHEALSRFNLKK